MLSNDADRNGTEHLVFSAADQLFALPYQDLLQILDTPTCTALPLAPRSVRGVIDVQGSTVPLIDMRVLLGAKPLREEMHELITTIAARRQDHVNWLKRLRDAVYQEQEITVQTDPHQCNFGLWYDRYTTSSSNFANYLKRFDKPHQAVHRVAVRAKELMHDGRLELAKELIHDTEHTVLAGLLALFDGFETQLRRHTHEYAIIIQRTHDVFALAVDSIAVFERFSEATGTLPATMQTRECQFITGIGRLQIGTTVRDVLIVDPDRLRSADQTE
jgi:purine-binding chemotaxis protein CheW